MSEYDYSLIRKRDLERIAELERERDAAIKRAEEAVRDAYRRCAEIAEDEVMRADLAGEVGACAPAQEIRARIHDAAPEGTWEEETKHGR